MFGKRLCHIQSLLVKPGILEFAVKELALTFALIMAATGSKFLTFLTCLCLLRLWAISFELQEFCL